MFGFRGTAILASATLAAGLMSAGPGVSAPIVGVAVGGIGLSTQVGFAPEVRAGEPFNGKTAIKFLIPLDPAPTSCTYGISNCGMQVDYEYAKFTGQLMKMFFKFSGVESKPQELKLIFEDLDLIGVNDPYGFKEEINVKDAAGNSISGGPITNISSPYATGNSTGQILTFLLPKVSSPGSLWIQLNLQAKMTVGHDKWKNTPEYVRAELSAIPLPAAAWLLVTALGGLVVAGRRGRSSPL